MVSKLVEERTIRSALGLDEALHAASATTNSLDDLAKRETEYMDWVEKQRSWKPIPMPIPVKTITLPICAKCGRAVDDGYGIIIYGTIVKASAEQELLAGDPQGQEAMAYHAICIARILNHLIGDAVHKESTKC